jgi:hypothetical protein
MTKKIYLTEQEKKEIENLVNGLEIDIDHTFSKDQNGDLNNYGIDQYFQAQKDKAISILNPDNKHFDFLHEYVPSTYERYENLKDGNHEDKDLIALNYLACEFVENLN